MLILRITPKAGPPIEFRFDQIESVRLVSFLLGPSGTTREYLIDPIGDPEVNHGFIIEPEINTARAEVPQPVGSPKKYGLLRLAIDVPAYPDPAYFMASRVEVS